VKDRKEHIGGSTVSAQRFTAGMAAYQKGNYAGAEEIFAQLIGGAQDRAFAWHMRGVCCLMMAKLDKAESHKLDKAAIYIRNALKLRRDAEFYVNLGIALAEARKTDEAIAAYRESLSLKPDNAKVCSNLGNLLKERWELEEAEALYRKAIALEPKYAHALANLGALLMGRKSYGEAETLLRKALTLNPALSKAAAQLGRLLENTGRIAEAAPLFETAGEWNLLAKNLRSRASWHNLARVDAASLSDLESGRKSPASPWALLNVPAMTPQLQRKAALDFASAEYGEALQLSPMVNAVVRNGPLRIGYLSADYHDHATMHLLAGVLEAHDPGQVEVHLLSINPYSVKSRDGYAQRIAAMPATFHDLSSASDADAAERIAALAPHLLIDLKGYTTDARPNIAARRPAPLIVSWLGYPGTLGHERLADYIIGDSVVTPPEHASHFSETLALIPHTYQPNDDWQPLGRAPDRAEAGLPETGFVFCSFNQFLKINPETFDVWCRLLAVTPGSVLWLIGECEEGIANLRREARKRGITDDRLVFAPRKPRAEHLARLQLADLSLDTFPCNSHTTASDALRAGVPLVTRIGGSFAGRVAASVLTTHGFPELIARSDQSYFELALSLAHDPARLSNIRLRLRDARQTSPLFDAKRFARDLERLYQLIWSQRDVPRNHRSPIALMS
jgi:protein O-GlcNAc transferase